MAQIWGTRPTWKEILARKTPRILPAAHGLRDTPEPWKEGGVCCRSKPWPEPWWRRWSLREWSRIYGIVGDRLNPVTDARRRNGKIQWVHVRHERRRPLQPGRRAQLTGKLAVCAGSCGPGNLHLINGLFDAHRSMAPVLAIASHIPTSEIGAATSKKPTPGMAVSGSAAHYCELVSNPSQMPRVLQTAIAARA